MKLLKLVLPLIIPMIFFIGMPQSAFAFEVGIKECAACYKDIVVDKVAMSNLEVTVAEKERQMLTGYSQLGKNVFYYRESGLNASKRTAIGSGSGDKLITADYLMGYKSRPGWQA